MTLSSAKRHRATACLLVAAALAVGGPGTAFAADPPTAQMAAAAEAVAAAERAQPQGQPAAVLAFARTKLAEAQDLVARRKYRDAARLAETAQAAADLSLVQDRQMDAVLEVESREARNAELRRNLLVLGNGSAAAVEIAPPPPLIPEMRGTLVRVRGDEDDATYFAGLQARIGGLDADPELAPLGALERWKAKQALAAYGTAKSRDRGHVLALADSRVLAAESAANAEYVKLRAAQLDRERDQIELEASRRQAEAAQKEADRLRRQALAREEEAQMLAASMAAEREALELSSANSDAEAEQARKLAEARAEETRLARKEAELASALAADSATTSATNVAPPPPARTSGKRTVYTLPGTAFSSGSATLAPSANASIRSLFSAIGSKKTLRVEAHTDNQGPDAANLALSKQRAEAVKRALVAAGIGAARVTAVGKGETSPVADNATADGRARNRRVEIVVE